MFETEPPRKAQRDCTPEARDAKFTAPNQCRRPEPRGKGARAFKRERGKDGMKREGRAVGRLWSVPSDAPPQKNTKAHTQNARKKRKIIKKMRDLRTRAVLILALGLLGQLDACSADKPKAPPPVGGGGHGPAGGGSAPKPTDDGDRDFFNRWFGNERCYLGRRNRRGDLVWFRPTGQLALGTTALSPPVRARKRRLQFAWAAHLGCKRIGIATRAGLVFARWLIGSSKDRGPVRRLHPSLGQCRNRR